jgi:amidase
MENDSYGRREFLKVAGASAALSTLASCRDTNERDAQSSLLPGTTSPPGDLCFATAGELAGLIRSRKVSAREVMVAHLERINKVNPRVNAIVAKLPDEKCLELADAADQSIARKDAVGVLHGLPIAFKDLQAAVGFPWTRGSPIYKNAMPEQDSLLVERLRAGGAIAIGKTNVPEFGMGSHTYNKVYGTTLNPYDLTRSAGGSSGGAAAALATGMLPIADGSDYAGSLRNPGNFNNVVGMRPSNGLVPVYPGSFPFLGFAVVGPLARNVSDVALLLSVIAGDDPRDPGSYPSDPALFRQTLKRDFRGTRIAWCPDLGGLPLDPRVRTVLDSQRKTFEDIGCIVEDAVPDLSGADEVFLTIRNFRNAALYGDLLKTNRKDMKPEAIYEVESGQKLSGSDVSRAMMRHAQLLDRVRKFQEQYEFTVCAVNQVPPFDATVDWPREIDGVKMENYVSWMKSAYWITVTARPAISVPAGFTTDRLPVGIQIVGRYRNDFPVLQLANAFEQATHVGSNRPGIVTGG